MLCSGVEGEDNNVDNEEEDLWPNDLASRGTLPNISPK
jgi:hypothetical protein